MAKFDKDSTGGTILVVVLLSLICSIIVAGAAVALKPQQDEQKALDKQRNILSVAGLLQPNTNIKEVYAEHIEPRLVDLATGEYVESNGAFDAKASAKNPAESVAIKVEDDKAGIKVRSKFAEIYLVKGNDGKIKQYILPIYGTGLWSVLYGFVALEPDMNTIDGITYYEQGETAGLGGEIANPLWQAKFVGKKLFDEQDQIALHIGKNASNDRKYGVDALSGATLTSNGVQGSFSYWFGKNGFGPFIAKVKAGAQ